jgi:hypothetical protein
MQASRQFPLKFKAGMSAMSVSEPIQLGGWR